MATEKFNLAEFKAYYTGYINDKKKDIAQGKIKGLGNPYPGFVSYFKWEQTEAQAIQVQKALLQMGGKYVSIEKIRAQTKEIKEFWDFIDAKYQQYKKDGYNGKEAKFLIAQNYFGSN